MRRGATIRQWIGDVLALGSFASLAWSAIGLFAGGMVLHAGPLALASRDPLRPFVIGVGLGTLSWLLLGRERLAKRVRPIVGPPGRRSAHVSAGAALALFAVATSWNTRAAGGSDSSCYVLQAEAFAQGRATLAPVLSELPTGVSRAALAPTGFIPARGPGNESVPICGPGLALMMAPLAVVSRDLVFLLVPLFGALTVWWTFVLGLRLSDAPTAACAAVLVATSPIFLYQAVQPMSDVPATALYLGALVFALRGGSRGALAAGVCAGLALLTRPNLAPIVALLPFLLTARNGDRPRLFRSARWGGSSFSWFVAGAAPAVIVMLALNAVRYGSPLASGYGDSGRLFALRHVAPNLARYPGWLLATQSPLLLLALAAPALLWRRGYRRQAAIATTSVAVIIATYLAYTVFDDWWYIRFLLPALPILIVFMTVVLFAVASRLWPSQGRRVAMLVCALLASWYVDTAIARRVLDLRGLESRFRIAGDYAARSAPPNAVMLSVQQSGSLRFYARRATLAWDAVEPAALDGAIASLRGRGFTPLFALEDGEEGSFRLRFASQEMGRLDWPPRAEIHAPVRVRIYDPADRAAYLGGRAVPTEHVWR